jgi:hypothetical protein
MGGDVMVAKKYLAIAISVAVCLSATLFLVVPSLSASSVHSYDPLLDVNDDGAINIIDISKVAAAFKTSGTPINKTALLLGAGANAISFNSTFAEVEVTVNETDYVDMPDMSVSITLQNTSSVVIMFSAEATIGDAGEGIFVGADVGGTAAVPFFAVLATPTSDTLYNAHSFNFYADSVEAGTYTVSILWKVSGGTGYVRNRSLVVIVLPA